MLTAAEVEKEGGAKGEEVEGCIKGRVKGN